MKKGYRTILTACMLLIAYTAAGQQPEKDMDAFPSTEEALSQIGSAAARSPKQPADTAALTSPAQRKGFIRRIIDYYSRSKRKSTGASSPARTIRRMSASASGSSWRGFTE